MQRTDGLKDRRDRSRRRRRRWVLPVLSLAVMAVSVLPFILRSRVEQAGGPDPEAVAPYGVVSREKLEFRWAVPADGAPVRVEVYDAMKGPIWTSSGNRRGFLRPPRSEVLHWPLADLLWRPVATPENGPPRAGDLAAFTLAP